MEFCLDLLNPPFHNTNTEERDTHNPEKDVDDFIFAGEDWHSSER